jgi:CheY-like chemotaxis protein
VCVISTHESRDRAIDAGALGFIPKPIQSKDLLDEELGILLASIERPVKRALVGAGDEPTAEKIVGLIACDWAEAAVVTDAEDFIEALGSDEFDCAVLDARLGVDLSDVDLACGKLSSSRRLPLIGFGEFPQGVLPRLEAVTLQCVTSIERLSDLAAVHLHHRVSRLPADKRHVIESLHRSNDVLAGRRVLIVDDDIRNVYALATVLEDHDMLVVSASSGREALTVMKDQELDIVLMDIMMPEMDGISVMREARKLATCRNLPIVAVTAKAMKGDRERCIEAGAWDYLSKPVDSQQLLAVLRSWLYR